MEGQLPALGQNKKTKCSAVQCSAVLYCTLQVQYCRYSIIEFQLECPKMMSTVRTVQHNSVHIRTHQTMSCSTAYEQESITKTTNRRHYRT